MRTVTMFSYSINVIFWKEATQIWKARQQPSMNSGRRFAPHRTAQLERLQREPADSFFFFLEDADSSSGKKERERNADELKTLKNGP